MASSSYLSATASWVFTAAILVGINFFYDTFRSKFATLGACLIAQMAVHFITSIEVN